MENEAFPISWLIKENSKSNRKYRFKNVKYLDIKAVNHKLNESEYPDSDRNNEWNKAREDNCAVKNQPN